MKKRLESSPTFQKYIFKHFTRFLAENKIPFNVFFTKDKKYYMLTEEENPTVAFLLANVIYYQENVFRYLFPWFTEEGFLYWMDVHNKWVSYFSTNVKQICNKSK